MKSWIIVLTLFTAFFNFAPARADLVEVLNIQADYFPNREYAIGLDLDANRLISHIYFQDQNENQTFYTLDQLSDFTTMFQVAGIKLVQIRISQQAGPESATIELNYTENYLRGLRTSIFFQVQYNAATGAYDITDTRSNQVIHSVKVTTRYSMFLPIGIESVDTQ